MRCYKDAEHPQQLYPSTIYYLGLHIVIGIEEDVKQVLGIKQKQILLNYNTTQKVSFLDFVSVSLFQQFKKFTGSFLLQHFSR